MRVDIIVAHHDELLGVFSVRYALRMRKIRASNMVAMFNECDTTDNIEATRYRRVSYRAAAARLRGAGCLEATEGRKTCNH